MEEEKEKEKKTRRISINFHFNKILLLIVIVSLLFLLFIALKNNNGTRHREEILKLGFENVGELVTQTCHTRLIEDSKEPRSFFNLFDIPLTTSRQIFSIDFDVDASLQFGEIKLSVDDSKKEITIVLPHSKVKDVISHDETLKVYLDSESLFSRITLEKNTELRVAMKQKAQKECVDNNLLGKADDNAQKLIEGLINSVEEFKNYKKVFRYSDGDENE